MSNPFTRVYEPIPPMSAVTKLYLEAIVGKHGMFFLEERDEEYKRFSQWPKVINVNGYAYRFEGQRISRGTIDMPSAELIKLGEETFLMPTNVETQVRTSVATYSLICKIVRVSEDSMFDGL